LERTAYFKKERFVYIYIITILFNLLIGSLVGQSNSPLFGFSVVSSLILLVSLAKWLEFPWVVTELERWLNRMGRLFDRKFGDGERDKIEPL
jgi:antibiotic biosynthesis monooxygenase (ABM) superfamily enzyme